MKHLKIKLSVLALACLGAGAFALQSTANAKADGDFDVSGLKMVNGASVCVSTDFSGIRWTTTIDAEWYAGLDAEKTYNFGVIVAPTAQLGTDEVLTHEDTNCVDLPFTVEVDEEGALTTNKYYSAINYDDIVTGYKGELSEAEVLAKAYAMELTARAYVQVGEGEYYYASLAKVDTSRSARQVAIAAEIAGDLDKFTDEKQVKAANYYGATSRLEYEEKGSIKSGVVDLSQYTEESEQKFTIGLKLTGDVAEAYLGNKIGGNQKLGATYDAENEQVTLTLPEGKTLPTGEHYLTMFTASGEAVVQPVIFATKVLKTASDLAMFNAKGDNYDRTTKVGTDGAYIKDYWKPEQEQSGYYVLGGNIDANAYTHGSKNAADAYKEAGKYNVSTWNAASSYRNKPIGLTGTFNGMGYTIDGMTIGNQREGVFGIVNGGTVKNVAFTDVKTKQKGYAYVLANYLLDAKIDNVYIATNQYVDTDKTNNPGFLYGAGSAILAHTAYKTTISNILLRLNKWSGTSTASTFGALFGGTHGSESFTCENVFVYVRNHFQYLVEGTTEIDGVEKTTYKQTTAQYYTAMVTIHPELSGEIMKTVEEDGKQVEKGTGVYTVLGDEKGEDAKGLLYLASNQTLTIVNKKNNTTTTFCANAYETKILTGVYYYGQNDDWGKYDPAGFLESGCWTAKSGSRPTWITR